ncbi:transporter substrate-binding domain-containing protein [Pseudalkalibacillus hwajinpoensis]|uniref:Transporter substrate-binding domain-containing protein n=1 Tax=Guptibacillus hwajinpoensis TaxID=208199 RepID=A0A4U1MNE6_9BACL|nr:transporter substrate-binding domain-containing protein [Pseudalkalibacillus hwajinpoensis]TKD72517.1 transporter substrate-binding domain-containing protein [Pseudalkalibacillus hwajinpoensis]
MKQSLIRMALILAVMTLLAACNSNNSEEKTTAWGNIQQEGTIEVATSGTLYPTSYHEQETNDLTGFDVEIVKEVAKRLDVKVDFIEMGFDGMLTAVQTGKVDMAANDIGITEERKEKFALSTPYKFSYGTAIVRKDDLSGIESINDLEGKKAAGAATTNFMKLAKKKGAEEVIYDNATNEQYLRDVETGRTDVILNDVYLQRLALAAFPELNLTIHPDIQYMPSEGGLLMNKENEQLIKKVNGVIKNMLEDGTISDLSKEFFNGADVTELPEDIEFQQ